MVNALSRDDLKASSSAPKALAQAMGPHTHFPTPNPLHPQARSKHPSHYPWASTSRASPRPKLPTKASSPKSTPTYPTRKPQTVPPYPSAYPAGGNILLLVCFVDEVGDFRWTEICEYYLHIFRDATYCSSVSRRLPILRFLEAQFRMVLTEPCDHGRISIVWAREVKCVATIVVSAVHSIAWLQAIFDK